jgi:hypothetical protein
MCCRAAVRADNHGKCWQSEPELITYCNFFHIGICCRANWQTTDLDDAAETAAALTVTAVTGTVYVNAFLRGDCRVIGRAVCQNAAVFPILLF